MILIVGHTPQARQANEVLSKAGKGLWTVGGMAGVTADACRVRGVRLVVDAADEAADDGQSVLRDIVMVLGVPLIRYPDEGMDGPYGLRRRVERLLPDYFELHTGITTGTCATAAAVAATLRLLKQETPRQVAVRLPNGESIAVDVGYGDGYAYCIKDAGDDPDVTDGVEIRAAVTPAARFEICGGEGVGRFTLPGFDYPPGEAAINRTPRQMLHENVARAAAGGNIAAGGGAMVTDDLKLRITISIPGGEELARRTFNPRLGIVGGISVLGVSGIVMPYSEQAFVDSIRRCVGVARASGSERLVLNSGMKSEQFLRRRYPEVPAQAFVQYGDFIGETLRIAAAAGFAHITIGIMMGKAVKLAGGQLDTHVRQSTMDRDFIAAMLREAGVVADIADMTLARELWHRIPEEQTGSFCRTVLRHCLEHCQPLAPQSVLTILLIADDGTIHSL